MTTRKKYCAAILLSLVLGVGPMTAPAWSALPEDSVDIAAGTADVSNVDPAASDLDSETPAFDNPAQAQHAANIAQQAATENTAVQEALQDVDTAQDTLDQALQSNDPEAVAAARDALTAAEEGYMESLAEITGVIEDDIASMRDSGMGWGEISHELGVHPGMLGLGHTRGKRNHYVGDAAEPGMGGIDPEELSEATARNMESGWSKGHGVGIQAGVHDPGTGLSEGRSRGRQSGEESNGHAFGGVGGAGGLGHGGGSDNSMGGSSTSSNHGGESSMGGGSTSSGGPGHSGGSSNAGGHGTAGTDGSPGNSGNAASSGNAGSSGGHGSSDNSGNSGSQNGSSGHGGGGNSGGHGNSGDSGGNGGGRW